MMKRISKTERQILELAKDYAGVLNEGAFVRNGKTPEDVAAELRSQASLGAIVKIVVNGHIYDIKDIYTIEDDDTSPYVCIEGE